MLPFKQVFLIMCQSLTVYLITKEGIKKKPTINLFIDLLRYRVALTLVLIFIYLK